MTKQPTLPPDGQEKPDPPFAPPPTNPDFRPSHHSPIKGPLIENDPESPITPAPTLVSERLVAFLYILMRDQVVPGLVEEIMREHTHPGLDLRGEYSNEGLETYARDVAKRLTK